ncbi:5-dehydro-4-deoxy-D-glucuronate isomerase [Fibrella forsythiae]|uniref:4-deoxy-L-threo-5-hexosulose-uronate ketol-isomerase n=1 Tax=Fibrella forsythiae TaxID=2817061 RepID=A0ABS3JN36_9BACT|nr:5-dehydro-4-deoxy-D-glucuronate isomerase [Fibrella forsythiae]MBO0951425.1 5-dehydro-4-deoxy-D-glucuronate isomerase [Fibrella forsythiae]
MSLPIASLPIRHAIGLNELKHSTTESLRADFLIESLFEANTIQAVYTHYDRVIVGGALPTTESVTLPTYDNLKSTYFLERRELGIINVGGSGSVTVDGTVHSLNKLDGLYVGKGCQDVSFQSAEAADPARFFLMSAPAHAVHPTAKLAKEEANPTRLGARETANERTIYKYIHAAGLASCQLVMGLTVLESGSIWNTMPAHVHDRRMETYLYFDVPADHRVFHLMGPPDQTRHIVVANHQAILSPPWSIHSGAGTASYSFIWGMAGENLDFADMDFAPISTLR